MTTEQQPSLVMCRPDYFEVSYAINPWMDPNAWSANKAKLAGESRRQWENLVSTLHGLGAEVLVRLPEPGVPDMVFTANAAIVLDGKALLARFRDKERQAEEPHFLKFFNELKSRRVLKHVKTLPEGMFQEGTGDCTWDAARQQFWAGYGQRSRREACDMIADYFGRKVVPLELVDPRFYHVDTCLAPLPDGHILYYPAAFSETGRADLERHAGGAEWLIAADAADADQLGVNLVGMGKTLVMAACSRDLEGKLFRFGYKVKRCPLPAFGMSGGAAFCLTLRVNHFSREARIRAAA